MIYMFLAEGFEETEALATLDVIRRAELEIATVGIGRKIVTGSHGIPVTADVMDCEVIPDENCEGVILPGGMPGTLNLEKSETVQSFLDYAGKHSLLICAICAAPSILGHKGLLEGKNATCFPGYEEQLTGAKVLDKPVCVDDNIITAKGAGVSLNFGFEIVRHFRGIELARHIEASMQCRI